MEDDFNLSGELTLASVSFFVAKRLHDQLELDWFRFSIDGVDVPYVQIGPLPNDQGWWAQIGRFERGNTFKLDWAFRTGINVPSANKIQTGYFQGNSLRNRVLLDKIAVNPFQKYDGTASVTVR